MRTTPHREFGICNGPGQVTNGGKDNEDWRQVLRLPCRRRINPQVCAAVVKIARVKYTVLVVMRMPCELCGYSVTISTSSGSAECCARLKPSQVPGGRREDVCDHG